MVFTLKSLVSQATGRSLTDEEKVIVARDIVVMKLWGAEYDRQMADGKDAFTPFVITDDDKVEYIMMPAVFRPPADDSNAPGAPPRDE